MPQYHLQEIEFGTLQLIPSFFLGGLEEGLGLRLIPSVRVLILSPSCEQHFSGD